MSDLSQRLANLSPEKRELVLKMLQKQRLIPESEKGAQEPPIVPISRDQALPLSFAQERLWFLSQLEEGSVVYNMPAALRLAGSLDRSALERSIHEIVRRHEALRTTFRTEHGSPVQVIVPKLTIPLPIVDLRQMPKNERVAEIQHLIDEEARRAFDLVIGPLLRVTLLCLDEEEHVLLLTIHHIVSDEWSIGVFIREVVALYNAFSKNEASPLPELTIQYADFAQWHRQWLQGGEVQQHLAYWKELLTGELPVLELPADRLRVKRRSFQGASQSFRLPEALTNAIKSVSRQEGVTEFMLLLAAFNILLYRYTAQEDILVGTAFANRSRAEIEALIGFFVNTVVLRANLSGNPTFRELLVQVREHSLEAQAHQDVPFEQVVAELQPDRDFGQQPLFQVMFVFENVPMPALKLSGLTLTPLEVHSGTTKFDLTLVMSNTEQGLEGFFEYSTELFDDSTITRMIGHFQTLLEAVSTAPESRIRDLSILTKAEYHQIVEEWNDTKTAAPRRACIHELFEAQVERTPNAIAVIFEEQQLTYQELNRRANQLAHYLRSLGTGVETLVGVCVERSIEMIVGVLGVLKAGGAYVPLDPGYPEERLAFMLEDSQVPILLTQERLLSGLPEHSARVICLDSDWKMISRERGENPASSVEVENLAYVIYTSGSTGKPKGVLVTHKGIPNLCQVQIRAFDVHPSSRVLQFASFSFDASVSEIFVTFLAGATLVMATQEALLPGSALRELFNSYEISVVTFPPSMLAVMNEEEYPLLKTVVSAGESCSAEIAERWSPGRRFLNAYGPTEATVCATINERIIPGQSPSIGHAIANTQMYVVDSSLQPVPIGVPGELLIGGVGIARGYLNRQELTNDRFLPDRFSGEAGGRLYKTGDLARYRPDGSLEFLGRIDHQVKLRGFRIELGEIESLLVSHPTVREAVVIVGEDASDSKQLLAYVVPESGQEITRRDLHRFLHKQLPEYMVPAPSAFLCLERLPLTPNGKVDRRALPRLTGKRPELGENFAAPRTPIEEVLVKIWAEILSLDRVGIFDSFFDLGGHSLLSVKLMFRVKEVFQLELSLQNLFEAPTVADFAQLVEAYRGVDSSKVVLNSSLIDVEAETRLDPDIRPVSSVLSTNVFTEPSAIFLTGSTGFLGAFLLDELLQQTTADIYCLVRASSKEEGRKRIQNNLEAYSLTDTRYDSRIIPVPGDLGEPLFGLSSEEFEALTRRIDVIYHNGAIVNLIYPYSALKSANVLGTQEILRLASQVKVKPVHYISTMSIFLTVGFAKKRTVYESTPLDPFDEVIHEGYAQSKWIAEKLLEEARSRGIPTTIYRPGTVSGHSQTGAWNVNDVPCRLLKGCIQLGKAPYKNVIAVYLTPVDYVTKAIVYLSQQQSSQGKIFHLTNPQPMFWNDIMDWVYSFGYPLQRMPYRQWQLELAPLATDDTQENVLYPLFPVYLESEPDFYELQTFDCQQTVASLVGSAMTCPPAETLLHMYFSYFIRSGFLEPPRASRKNSTDKV